MKRLSVLLLAGALLAGAAAVSACGPPTHASAGVAVGPPGAPADGYYYDYRDGYVWVEGHWVWNGYEYVWQPGYWVESRPGFVYIQGYWDLRGGHYYWSDGYWARHRPGYVYARGHWTYRDGRRVWQRGRWMPQRRGHTWQPGYWDRSGGKYVWRKGQWRKGPARRDHRRPGVETVPSRRGGTARPPSRHRSAPPARRGSPERVPSRRGRK